MDTSCHFIGGDIERNRLDITFVIDRILGKYGHQMRPTDEFQQYVHLVKLETDAELIVVGDDAVKGGACLQSF